MKKLGIRFTWPLLALLAIPGTGGAATTLSGSVRDLGTNAVTTDSFVRFYLRGCADNQPTVPGVAILGPSQSAADGSGNNSGMLYSTRENLGTDIGEIECGNSFTAVWDDMVMFQANKAGREAPIHARNGVTPITANPVVTAPTGDGTYLRIDGGNSPVTESIGSNGDVTFSSSIKAIARANIIGCNIFKAIQCVDGTNQTIAQAIQALPSTGGEIYVSSIGSPYTVALGALTISKNTRFVCESPKNTVINFTGVSGAAFLFNNTTSGLQDWNVGIENCEIIGPGGFSGGASNAGTGVQVGSSTSIQFGLRVTNSIIAGFAVGVGFSTAGASQAQFMALFQHDSIVDNTQEFVSTINSGIGGGAILTKFDHVNFTQQVSASNPGSLTIGGSTGQSVVFQDCYFNSEQFSISGAADVIMNDPSFENATGNTTTNFITFSGQLLTLNSPIFLQDFSSGAVPTEFVSASVGNLVVYNWRASTQKAMGAVFRVTGSATYNIWGDRETDGTIAELIDTSTSTHKTFMGAAQAISATGFQVYGVPQIYNVKTDFTVAANTNLQLIPGLTWTMPANEQLNAPFSCHLMYSQATAAVADQFGIQDVTVAPTNIAAKAQAYISTSAFTAGNLPTLTTTTATPIVTFTPSATGTVFNADIDGFIEQPLNGEASAIQIMVQTSNAADLITVKRGTFCRVF